MPFKIVRNDITKMQVDAIVNTANRLPIYSDGTDSAVYEAAGVEELLAERRKIGTLEEGQAAITPGFRLPAKYIIHAVSPMYIDGESGEEELLRSCYRKSLKLACEKGCKSIAFPLIATGSFGYPKEEGMRIALDEINAFLMKQEMHIYLVVFDTEATRLGRNVYPDLEEYIDKHYVEVQKKKEYWFPLQAAVAAPQMGDACREEPDEEELFEERESALDERLKHLTDTFQEYLMYLIESKGLSNADVYKSAYLTKQLFSKIKLNPDYHPDKGTALRLCVGAQLNLDETKDLLARAGYALSPCDKRDVIFSFFIEQEIYDMLDIDIALEEYGLPCFIE
ncbi:MAG: macro domain-containing protein [Lachnospiraceae bacterium]|nr:macro domain-containing protein [Lachnospiraceae bacterium]